MFIRSAVPAVSPLAVVAAVMLAGSACSGQPPTASPPTPPTAADPVPAPSPSAVTSTDTSRVQLLSASTSGFTEGAELVLRSDSALTAAWNTAHAGVPGNPPPRVDFSQRTVLLLALGERRTGGYSIAFDNLARSAAGAVVHYTATSPGPGCMTTQMITSPVVVVSVPRVEGPVRFERREVVNGC